MRERSRLIPQQLERAGWNYVSLWSVEVFTDPQTVASLVQRYLGLNAKAKSSATEPREQEARGAHTRSWQGIRFATSQEQDGQLLEITGQMPMREDLPSLYADYFKAHPDYTTFAEQAARTVEVPNVPNSVEIWQTFRDAYTESVIFGRGDVRQSFDQAAEKVKTLAAGS